MALLWLKTFMALHWPKIFMALTWPKYLWPFYRPKCFEPAPKLPCFQVVLFPSCPASKLFCFQVALLLSCPTSAQNIYGSPMVQNFYGPLMAQNIYGSLMVQNIYGPPMAQNIYGPPMAQNALISINQDKCENNNTNLKKRELEALTLKNENRITGLDICLVHVIFEVLKLSSNFEYLCSFNFQLKNAGTKYCFLGHLYAIKVP
jgi:hypothetical protein